MNQTFLALSLGFAGVILAAHATFAQPQCGPRPTMVEALAGTYGESLRAAGLAQNAVMELYASADTGTWTIALTLPDGTMCLVAAGQDFNPVDAAPPARGARI